MRHSIGLQISDLEAIPSVFEQELTLEEAKQVVGGYSFEPTEPIEILVPDLPDMFPDTPNLLEKTLAFSKKVFIKKK